MACSGYKSTRTSSQHPINWSLSQRGMLEFTPKTGVLRNDSKATEGYGDPTMGYQFGFVLIHSSTMAPTSIVAKD